MYKGILASLCVTLSLAALSNDDAQQSQRIYSKAIQQQVVEANKNERANALLQLKRLCKEFGLMVGMLNGSMAKGRGEI